MFHSSEFSQTENSKIHYEKWKKNKQWAYVQRPIINGNGILCIALNHLKFMCWHCINISVYFIYFMLNAQCCESIIHNFVSFFFQHVVCAFTFSAPPKTFISISFFSTHLKNAPVLFRVYDFPFLQNTPSLVPWSFFIVYISVETRAAGVVIILFIFGSYHMRVLFTRFIFIL